MFTLKFVQRVGTWRCRQGRASTEVAKSVNTVGLIGVRGSSRGEGLGHQGRIRRPLVDSVFPEGRVSLASGTKNSKSHAVPFLRESFLIQ